MAVNKVVFGAVSIMDISDSTVTEETLAEGVTAYRADGEKITGTMKAGGADIGTVDVTVNVTGTVSDPLDRLSVEYLTYTDGKLARKTQYMTGVQSTVLTSVPKNTIMIVKSTMSHLSSLSVDMMSTLNLYASASRVNGMIGLVTINDVGQTAGTTVSITVA